MTNAGIFDWKDDKKILYSRGEDICIRWHQL